MERNIKRWYPDVAYASASEMQKMDIYLPEAGNGPFPVLLEIHGGGFVMMDKRDGDLNPWLLGLRRGYAVAAVNYRRAGEGLFPAAVIDCKAALRFIKAEGAKYHLDGTHIMAVGGSAGSNLAAMLNTSADVPELQDDSLGHAEYNTRILGSVNWYTPTDFTKSDEGIRLCDLDPFPCPHMAAGSPESSYMGGAIASLPYDYVQKANPMTYITKEMPPIYLQHGTKDALVPFYNSIQFAEKIRSICGDGRARLELLLGAAHADPRFETEEIMQKVFALIDQVMQSGSL